MKKEASTTSIARSTAMMSAAILVSRITGFIRTWAMAFALGNTALAAAFSLANNLPNMIYELVCGGILSTAFLPVYMLRYNSAAQDKLRADAAGAYASNLLSITLCGLGIIALVASVFAPQFMFTQTLFNAQSDETVSRAIWFFRFFAFQIIFYGASAIFSGLLNAQRSYFWPAVNSIFMNLVTIITFFAYPVIATISESAALVWLACGVTLSVAILACVQIPALVKCGFKFRFLIDIHGEGLTQTLHLAAPAVAITAINLFALSFMNSCALSVADNGPAAINYAWMWYQFPYGVLGVALSTALFTEMSDCASRKDKPAFMHYLYTGLKTTWLLIIPMAVLIFVCAYDLIGLYSAGKFSSDTIRPIAVLLRGWTLALPLYAAYMFLYRAYSSMRKLGVVALCNLCFTLVQITLYMLCTGTVGLPQLGNTLKSNLGLLGIAIGDIVFYTLMCISLLFLLHKNMGKLSGKKLGLATGKIILASLVGGASCYALRCALSLVYAYCGIFQSTSVFSSLVNVVVCGTFGLLVIMLVGRALGVDEISRLCTRLARRGRNAKA